VRSMAIKPMAVDRLRADSNVRVDPVEQVRRIGEAKSSTALPARFEERAPGSLHVSLEARSCALPPPDGWSAKTTICAMLSARPRQRASDIHVLSDISLAPALRVTPVGPDCQIVSPGLNLA